MKEIGIINRDLARIFTEQGHGDLLMIADAGFAIPKGIEVVDLSLSKNRPTIVEVLEELKKYFSVEKIILAKQTQEKNPSYFLNVKNIWDNTVDAEIIEHTALKQVAKKVKAVIRTGDFTAFGNVILVSGAGNRFFVEIH